MAETIPKDLLTITEAVAKFNLPESTIRLLSAKIVYTFKNIKLFV